MELLYRLIVRASGDVEKEMFRGAVEEYLKGLVQHGSAPAKIAG